MKTVRFRRLITRQDWCIWQKQWFMIVAFSFGAAELPGCKNKAITYSSTFEILQNKLKLKIGERKNVLWNSLFFCMKRLTCYWLPPMIIRPNMKKEWNMCCGRRTIGGHLFLSLNRTTSTQGLLLEIKGKSRITGQLFLVCTI